MGGDGLGFTAGWGSCVKLVFDCTSDWDQGGVCGLEWDNGNAELACSQYTRLLSMLFRWLVICKVLLQHGYLRSFYKVLLQHC